MAKKKTSAKPTKSDEIRAVMKTHPKASVKEIKAELDAKGISASIALINKLKYDRKRGTKSGKPQQASRGGISKADAIRAKFAELGVDARPRDVIAALKKDGVKVTSAQVSMLRAKATGGKAYSRTNGKAAKVPTTASSVPFEHLVAAKQLADRLGGVAEARAALESFAKLVSG